MARPLRIELPDGVYHVTSRGLERRAIVRDVRDRQQWVGLLDRVATRRGWRVLAWALMTNHFHLFLRTPHGDLSAGMHDLNAGYVGPFNRRHDRCGPLLQGRFKAILVERDYHYDELTRYVHLNPVRAGLVRQPDRYRWSSCRDYFRAGDVPPWLAVEEVLGQYGRTIRAARQAYRRFLLAGVASRPPSVLRDVVGSTLLGSSAFVDRMRRWLEGRLPTRDVPAAHALRRDVSVDDVVSAVCGVFGVLPESLAQRGQHHNLARSVAVYLCRVHTRASAEAIGKHFGGVRGAAVWHMVHRVTQKRARDRRLRAQLSTIEKQLRTEN